MYLYFLQSAAVVKIGIARNVEVRVRALSAGNPHGISIYTKLPVAPAAARGIEAALHRRYAAYKIGREWFRGLPLKEAVQSAREMIAARGEPAPAMAEALDAADAQDMHERIVRFVRAA